MSSVCYDDMHCVGWGGRGKQDHLLISECDIPAP